MSWNAYHMLSGGSSGPHGDYSMEVVCRIILEIWEVSGDLKESVNDLNKFGYYIVRTQ